MTLCSSAYIHWAFINAITYLFPLWPLRISLPRLDVSIRRCYCASFHRTSCRHYGYFILDSFFLSSDLMVRTSFLDLRFLANVNSSSCSLYVVVRPSVCRLSSVVCRLSVTFVRPTQGIDIFGNIFTPFCRLVIYELSVKILRRSSQGNPSIWG